MKNKNVFVKILIGGCFLISLLLIVILYSLIIMFVPKKTYIKEKSIISNNYKLDNIENITFDFKKSNSIFKVGSEDYLLIVQNYEDDIFYLNYEQVGNQIIFTESNYIINPQKKEYIIYLPKNYKNKISIINGFGKLRISDINNNININNNSGKISINDTKNTRIKNVSGNINLNNIFGDVDITSSTGDIKIVNIYGKINIESITGDIVIRGFTITGDSFIENISGNISLGINENSKCKLEYSNETGKCVIDPNICTKGDYSLNIKNITGKIHIY